MSKSSSETPLMQQHRAIKQKYPDAILLFRVGDFYETFGQKWGIPRCYMAGASCMLILQFTMWVYVTMFGTPPQEASSADTNKDATATTKESSSVIEKKKPKAGILEGIHLFVSHNYVKGIFAISCLYEIEVTIVVSSYL